MRDNHEGNACAQPFVNGCKARWGVPGVQLAEGVAMGIAVFARERSRLQAGQLRIPRTGIVPILLGAPASFHGRRWGRSSRRKRTGSRRSWFRIRVGQEPPCGAPGRVSRC